MRVIYFPLARHTARNKMQQWSLPQPSFSLPIFSGANNPTQKAFHAATAAITQDTSHARADNRSGKSLGYAAAERARAELQRHMHSAAGFGMS